MLQFITHTTERFPLPSDGAIAALDGGCRWIQLRMKGAAESELLAEGRRLRGLCDRYGAKLIVDDHVELVGPIGADGVHLGLSDMPVAEARRILGPGVIIGATANRFEHIARAAADGADYIGLGPFRFTTTKERLSPVLGLEGYRSVMAQVRQAGIELPVVAISGITAADVSDLMAAGVSGIAVSGAILRAADPVKETETILARL